MKILVLGLNYSPEKVGIAVYTTGMSEALVAQGHEVHVVAGQPYYPAWKIEEGYPTLGYTRGIENGVDITRAPHYVPKVPSGLNRLIHHVTFAISTLFPVVMRSVLWRPDIVLAVAPSLVAAPNAKIAALVCGARSWLHVQDFEAEAALATGLFSESSFFGKLAGMFEATVVRSFDRVSTISPQMRAKLIEKGVLPARAIEFRNWADIGSAGPFRSGSAYREEWSIDTPYIALYSGNIANKQGIEIVVDAARLLSHRKDLTFVVCGDGPNRAALEERAEGLENIKFRPLQPKERLPELLNLATVHLLPQIESAADLVLPSKLTNMLASGIPVITTALPGAALYEEVKGCGLTVNPGDTAGFAGAISQLVDDEEMKVLTGQNGRDRALKRWSKTSIIDDFVERLVALASDDLDLRSQS